MPDVELISHARPSLFAYPPQLEMPSEKKAEKVETAVLSTTAKSQARQRTKEKKKLADAMDTDADPADKQEEEKEQKDVKTEEPAPKPREPSFSHIRNATRVTPQQLKYVAFPEDARFVPVRPLHSSRGDVWADSLGRDASDAVQARRYVGSATGGGSGIVLLIDRKPGEPFKNISLSAEDNSQGAAEGGGDEGGAPAALSGDDNEDKGPTGVADSEHREPPANIDVEMGDSTAR